MRWSFVKIGAAGLRLDIGRACFYPSDDKMADDRPVTIQELRQRLVEAGAGAGRLAVLHEFRGRLAELPRAEAEGYLGEAVEFARKTGNHDDLARIGVVFCEFCLKIEANARSLECASIVQEAAAASGNPKHEGQYLYLVGRAHEAQGNYKLARDHYERCLKVWRKAGYTRAAGQR
jgi:tetratricopeptide (TPR) repeat protein